MNLKSLLLNNQSKYKQVFNLIFKEHLKGREVQEIEKIDCQFMDLWKRAISCEKYTEEIKGRIFLTEILDDLESPPIEIIDVAFFNYKTQSLEVLDFMPLECVVGLEIKYPQRLTEIEVIAQILYEFYLFGVNDEHYLKNETKRKKAWKELEKDLKEIYNRGNDQSL